MHEIGFPLKSNFSIFIYLFTSKIKNVYLFIYGKMFYFFNLYLFMYFREIHAMYHILVYVARIQCNALKCKSIFLMEIFKKIPRLTGI